MDKSQKLSHVVNKLLHVTEFLKLYLPLANVHNTNFIVSHHWDTMIPEGIASELLQLDDNQLSLLPTGELCSCELHRFDCAEKDRNASVNIVEAKSALSSKLDHITTCDPSAGCNYGNITHEVEIASTSYDTGDEKAETTTSCPCKSDIRCDCCPEWDHSVVPDWRHHNLHEFIMAAVSCTLPQLGLLTSLSDLGDKLGLQPFDTQSKIVVSHAMKIKKSYEVDVMCNLCAWIANGFNISTVSDATTCVLAVGKV